MTRPSPSSPSSKAMVSLFLATALTAASGCSPSTPKPAVQHTVPQQQNQAVTSQAVPAAQAAPPAPADYCPDANQDGYCDDDHSRIDTGSSSAYLYNGSSYYRRNGSLSSTPPAAGASAGVSAGSTSAGTASGGSSAGKEAEAVPTTSTRTGAFTTNGGGSGSSGAAGSTVNGGTGTTGSASSAKPSTSPSSSGSSSAASSSEPSKSSAGSVSSSSGSSASSISRSSGISTGSSSASHGGLGSSSGSSSS